MAAYTLLQLVDQVSGEMGLAQPSAVIGSTNNQTVQFLALVQRLGKDLIREFEWGRATKIYVFPTTAGVTVTGTTTNGSAVITSMSSTASLAATMVCTTAPGVRIYSEIVTVDSPTQVTLNMPMTASGTGVSLTFANQDYALPADYDRMVSNTFWDRTNHWQNLGVRQSQSWQLIQGGTISIGPRERYRIYGNKLRIVPALTAVTVEAFEYVSNFWVLASGGATATKSTATLDSDTFIFPDELMSAGLKYYFRREKGFDFTIALAEFNEVLGTRKAQDQPLPILSLAPVLTPELIGPWSVQDGAWPTTSIN